MSILDALRNAWRILTTFSPRQRLRLDIPTRSGAQAFSVVAAVGQLHNTEPVILRNRVELPSRSNVPGEHKGHLGLGEADDRQEAPSLLLYKMTPARRALRTQNTMSNAPGPMSCKYGHPDLYIG